MTRDEMIGWLILFTGWSKEVFKHMDDDKVEKLYMERVEKSMDVNG